MTGDELLEDEIDPTALAALLPLAASARPWIGRDVILVLRDSPTGFAMLVASARLMEVNTDEDRVVLRFDHDGLDLMLYGDLTTGPVEADPHQVTLAYGSVTVSLALKLGGP